MQLTLRDFLRDTLSGAREDPSIATTAVVIPVGRRTTLSLARRQIDASFNRIEKVLLPRVEGGRPHHSAQERERRKEPGRSGGARSFLGLNRTKGDGLASVLGAALGGALRLVADSSGYAEAAVRAGQAAVATASRTASRLAVTASAAAMQTLGAVRRGIAGTWTSVTNAVADTVGATRSEAEGFSERAGDYASHVAQDAWARVTHAVQALGTGGIVEALASPSGKIVAPDVNLSTKMVMDGAAALRKFAVRLYATLREWLWGAWRADDQRGTAGEAGGAGGSDAGTSQQPEVGGSPGGMATADASPRAGSGGQGGANPHEGYVPRDPGTSGVAGVRARGALAANQEAAYAAARAEGLSDSAARALVANFSGESLTNPADRTADRGTGQGMASWHQMRAGRIHDQFGKWPADMTVAEQMKAALWEMKKFPKEYGKTWAAIHSNASAEAILDTTVRNYEGPLNPDSDVVKRSGIMHGFKPAHDVDSYAPKPEATSTPTADVAPPPAPTASPLASPDASGGSNSQEGVEDYPDHGRHRRIKPHVVRTSAGMLIIGHEGYA